MLQSITRYILTLVIAYLVGKGVITQSQADSIFPTLLQDFVIILTGVVAVAWSFFEKDSKGVLAAYFPPPGQGSGPRSSTSKTPLLVLAASVIAVSLVSGCAGNTYTYTPTGSTTPVTITGFGAWCENNLPVIRSATKSSVMISAQVFIKHGTTSARIAGYVKEVESVLQPLLGQSQVSAADLDSALASAKLSDPSGIIAEAISPAIELVAGYVTQLRSDGVPEKVVTDVLTSLFGGLDDAAVALDPTTTQILPGWSAGDRGVQIATLRF